MTTQPIRLHLSLSDRKFLHDTSVFLGTCGFEVQTAITADLAGDQSLNFPVDVWVYEHAAKPPKGEESPKGAPSTARCEGSGPWRIAVLRDNSPASVSAAIAAGADDVIPPPLTPAKVLVRARHAASILQVTRGLHRDLHGPQYTELPGKGALLGRIQQLLDTREQHQESVCLGLFSMGIASPVPFASRLVSDRGISLLGTYLQNNLPPDAQLFHIDNHLFAVLAQAKVPQQTLHWCENRCEELNHGALGFEKDHLEGAIAVGFAWIHDHSDSAEDLFDMGLAHLRASCSAGGGLVVSDQVHSDLLSEQKISNLFEGMTAMDIARPLVTTLSQSATAEAAAEAMRHYHLDVVAVTDQEGQVVGLVTAESLAEHPPEGSIESLVDRSVPRLAHKAPFEELIASLAEAQSAWILVQKGDKAIGLVYCDDLAGMNSPVQMDPLYSPLANVGAG